MQVLEKSTVKICSAKIYALKVGKLVLFFTTGCSRFTKILSLISSKYFSFPCVKMGTRQGLLLCYKGSCRLENLCHFYFYHQTHLGLCALIYSRALHALSGQMFYVLDSWGRGVCVLSYLLYIAIFKNSYTKNFVSTFWYQFKKFHFEISLNEARKSVAKTRSWWRLQRLHPEP